MPPEQCPTKSKQDVSTPPEFLEVVERKWGTIDWDLAASHHNAVCSNYFTRGHNSLSQDWNVPGLKWCNPPYNQMIDWVKKASEWSMLPNRQGKILLLGPAAIETRWFRFYVWPFSRVHVLVSRIKFVGHANSFPKGLMVAEYGSGWTEELKFWDWKRE